VGIGVAFPLVGQRLHPLSKRDVGVPGRLGGSGGQSVAEFVEV
jgi:hypothetical protein